MEAINKIKELIRTRRTLEARKGLDAVGDRMDKLESFFEEIKKLIREQGRTNFVPIQDIENLIISIF